MENIFNVALGLILPLVGTTMGAAMVFVLRREMGARLERALLGFAAGVMIAASVWSLLIPAMDMAEASGQSAWLPAVGGFLCGMGFLLALDSLIPHLHAHEDKPEGKPSGLGRSLMLMLAVTLHNLPEGMAVGLSFAVAAAQNEPADLAAAFVLALGMSLQNFPEGAAVSLPLRSQGMGAGKAFGLGVLSGAVEPLFGLVAVLAAGSIAGAMPLVLSFAAGAMVYVVAQEMIPQATSAPHAQAGVASILVGFWLMMLLDALLG